MVLEVTPSYDSQWAAINAVAQKLGVGTAETVRKWVRQAEIDTGQRPGTTSEESAELKRLRQENAELRRANVLEVRHRVQAQLSGLTAPVLRAGVADLTAQLDALVGPGFVTAAGVARPPGTEPSPALGEIRRIIEELRVSRHAHPMRTRYPVSVKRIQHAIDAL